MSGAPRHCAPCGGQGWFDKLVAGNEHTTEDCTDCQGTGLDVRDMAREFLAPFKANALAGREPSSPDVGDVVEFLGTVARASR